MPVPTDALQISAGTQLVPAAVAEIEPSTVQLPAPVTDVLPPTPGGAQETEAEEPEDTAAEDMIGLEDSRAEGVTNFPKKGDDRTIGLRNSNYAVFPIKEAAALKAEKVLPFLAGKTVKKVIVVPRKMVNVVVV